MKNSVEWSLELPFPLPTWNRVLAMNHWQRKKLRDLTDGLVSYFVRTATDSLTRTDSAGNMFSIRSSLAAYSKMIRPGTSKASRTGKSRCRRGNQSAR